MNVKNLNNMPQSLLRRYVYDFTCMFAFHSSALDKDTQARIIWRLLELEGGFELKRISQVHGQFWKCEKRLHAIFSLIDALPMCKSALEVRFAFVLDSISHFYCSFTSVMHRNETLFKTCHAMFICVRVVCLCLVGRSTS